MAGQDARLCQLKCCERRQDSMKAVLPSQNQHHTIQQKSKCVLLQFVLIVHFYLTTAWYENIWSSFAKRPDWFKWMFTRPVVSKKMRPGSIMGSVGSRVLCALVGFLEKLPLHLLTFAFLPKGQGGWNCYFSFLPGTHVHHADIKALDYLSDAQHEPLRVPSFVWSTKSQANHSSLSINQPSYQFYWLQQIMNPRIMIGDCLISIP